MSDQAVLLEEIIRNELRPYVQTLVERLTVELVQEQFANGNGNGNGHVGAEVVLRAREKPQDRTAQVAEAPKTCRVCGQQKPAQAFGKNRRVCKRCRGEQVRASQLARARADEEEHPSGPPGSASTIFTPAS